MKQQFSIFFLTALVYLFTSSLFGQGTSTCPTEDISLTSQEEIEQFVLEYTGCDTIYGDLLIGENFNINTNEFTDLAPLSFIKHITGNLSILNNRQLMVIEGFQNLEKIDGDVVIAANERLIDWSGFQQLKTIGGSLFIDTNPQIVNFTGFASLDSIGGEFRIEEMESLENLAGLEQLRIIGDRFIIGNNPSLFSIEAILGLQEIGSNLFINNHPNLSNCSSICSLQEEEIVRGEIRLWQNNFGCLSLEEVLNICQGDRCLNSSFSLRTQEEVNRFSEFYQECDSLFGSLEIGTSQDIVDLTPLSFLRYIGGNVLIRENNQLTELNGLQNIVTIGGELSIFNNPISSLNGLSALNSIGSNLVIRSNNNLVDIAGLQQLTTVEGNFSIINNALLERIEQLHQINKIGGVFILEQNPQLFNCAVICSIQDNEVSATLQVQNNGFGCSTVTAITERCAGSTCLSGNIELRTQEELERFAEAVPNCDTLQGDLEIISDLFEPITDLSSLSFIKYIKGGLYLSNGDSLSSLDGLHQIQGIGKTLSLRSMFQLSNLEGLNQLEKIGEDFTIDGNQLTSLEGVNQLKKIEGNFRIERSLLLPSLNGLSQLTSIGGDMTLRRNDQLEDISIFQQITLEGNNLIILGNEQLADCQSICGIIDGIDFILIRQNKLQCSDLETLQISCNNLTVSTEDFSNDSFFLKVYPNPTKGRFHIEISNTINEDTQLRLLDIHGRLVQQQVIRQGSSGPFLFNFPTPKSGIYLIQWLTKYGTTSKRLMVAAD